MRARERATDGFEWVGQSEERHWFVYLGELNINYKDLTRPNSPQMVVCVGSSPPTTLFQVGEIIIIHPGSLPGPLDMVDWGRAEKATPGVVP